MRKFIITAVSALAITGAVASTASADVSTNGTTNDAQGYCIANHIAYFCNGNFNWIGHLRSQMTGKQIAAQSGNNAPAQTASIRRAPTLRSATTGGNTAPTTASEGGCGPPQLVKAEGGRYVRMTRPRRPFGTP